MNSQSADTRHAVRQVMRRYSLTLVGLVVAFAFLLILLFAVQYQRLAQQSAATLSQQLTDRASLLSARASLAIQQVERSRDSMENAFAAQATVSTSGLQRVDDAEKAQKPVGTYWTLESPHPGLVVEMIGDQTLTKKTSDREVRAAFYMAREVSADHSSNSVLFRSSYVSRSNSFIVFSTPAKHSVIEIFSKLWQSDKTLTVAKMLREIDGNMNETVVAATKVSDRKVRWLTPYVGDGFDQIQLALTAFVYDGSVFQGTAMKQYLATNLLAPGNSRQTGSNRFYVFTDEGILVDMSHRDQSGATLVKDVNPTLKSLIAAAKATPDTLVLGNDDQAILSTIKVTPWSPMPFY